MNIPALTTLQMAEVDRVMIEDYGITLIQMMENAGRNLAELARHLLGGHVTGRNVVVLCGSGNNGGGGMAAARHLLNWGAAVRVKVIANPSRIKEIPAHQWKILQAMGMKQSSTLDLTQAALILDALIGYGLTGNPRGPVAAWIEHLNAAKRPVLSLDVPSGLDASNGDPGNPCVHASATLTLALPKTGLLTPQAKPYVGDLYLADISVPPELYRRLGLEVSHLFAEDSILNLSRNPL
jgi:NAD(P)H-hydrate epimerase